MNNIKKMPVFRGRFGTRSVRRKSKKKWQRWRFPRGIDIVWKKGQIRKPVIGFGGDRKYKGLHPSGRVEVYVKNLKELKNHFTEHKDVIGMYIYRVASTVGAKKRLQIKEFAEKNGLKMINVKNVSKKTKKEENVRKEIKEKIVKEEKKVDNNEKAGKTAKKTVRKN